MSHPTVIDQPREWTRVIVLAPPSASRPPPASVSSAEALPEALRGEFERRDWFAVVLHDPYLAMAELALREKAQAARAAWGLQRMEGLALVIVEPTQWLEGIVADLCAAVRRWLPVATLWSAQGDRIEPVLETSTPPKIPVPKREPRQVFDLDALVDALPRGPAPSNGAAKQPTTFGAPPASAEQGRLTRDEIDMLLHMDADGDGAAPRETERGR